MSQYAVKTRAFDYAALDMLTVLRKHIENLIRFGYRIEHKSSETVFVHKAFDTTPYTIKISPATGLPETCSCEFYLDAAAQGLTLARQPYACKHMAFVFLIVRLSDLDGVAAILLEIERVYIDREAARNRVRCALCSGAVRLPQTICGSCKADAARRTERINAELFGDMPASGPIIHDEPWVPVLPEKPAKRRPLAVICEEM